MNLSLIKALVALVPAAMLFFGALLLVLKKNTAFSLLQLAGAGCLLVVVLTHVSEALQLFPWMHWGMQHSIGHYLDLCCATTGLGLFPIGYLLQAVNTPRRM